MSVGCKVTLRGERMYDFWKTVQCSIAAGMQIWYIPDGFDGREIFLGLKEQIIFQIDYDKVSKIRE